MTLSRRSFVSRSAIAAAAFAGRPLLGRSAFRDFPRAGSDFETLRASIRGTLLLPADAPYERARRTWSFNPRTDARPAAIVRCADADDVLKSVAFAREHSLELAVRGGGHDILGASTVNGGLIIDLSSMKAIEVDSRQRTARVQPGVVSGEFKAALPPDLAPVLGCNPAVGVAGLTLGGGIGWFLGTHGAACDNLASATIATAGGELLHVSENEHPDLFWAIRGGGGNFGIVTQLEYRVHPITTVVGGVVAFRQSDIGAFLRFYRDYMKAAPDPLAVEVSIFSDPDPVIWAMVCWNGPPDAGLRALEPLRTFATPIADTIEEAPWTRFLARMPQRTMVRTSNTYWRGDTLSVLSDGAISAFANSIASAPAGWQLGLGHYMHGRICDVAASATPFQRKLGQSTHFISASWSDGKDADRALTWVDGTWSALHQFADTGTYVNYLSESSNAAVRAAYGNSYERLAAIKRMYDPDNVFHRNRNIPPARA
ncbi:MAG TPA: FAD-binding oxidoreductase [Gemmatimonadaceae bacterium]|nr:FAD-binding oxidoreductase [Gemmatimonadaceae bacterium]